ncbi:hypothetical protein FACS189459_0630 [Bacilli bacterium]|nr:hypothetical protein FACS189459_0630 [Bacilli bacterium]
MTILSGISHKDAKIYAEQRLKDLNMWNLKNKSPNSFSSGQKKKILLAQALVHNPKIIIMDEPTANLDPKASLEFFETLHKLRSSGVAIFISSHILSELDAFSDSVTILDGGKIVFDGSKKELMEKHIQPKYLCSSSDDAKILTYLENKKIEKYIQNDGIIILFNDSKQINEFQKEAIEKNIYFNTFKKIEPSLYDIYDKLIVKGSVDTMKK